MLEIGNGTRNSDKIGAVNAACILVGAIVEMTNDETDSKIPPQPKKLAQMLRGAKNRAKEMRERYPNLDIWMGIESGVLEDYDDEGDGISMDLAVIVIVYGNGKKDWVYSTSPGVIFPEKFMAEWVASGREGTVGEIIAANLGGTKSDPHRSLTDGRVTRAQTLVDGIKTALLQLPPEILRR